LSNGIPIDPAPMSGGLARRLGRDLENGGFSEPRRSAGAWAGRAEGSRRSIGLWLLLLSAMIGVMVVLGGATRLTGSGLSIMEWAPVRGILPPLDEAEWERLFALYRTIPQYHLLHEGMGLSGFKGLFWLEWVHRLWGRLIGAALLLPLLWFWRRGMIGPRLGRALLLLFVLGLLQGAVGWFMVASGFFPNSTAVSPYRLVIHLGFALVLFAATLWLALAHLLPGPAGAAAPLSLRRASRLTLGLAFLTILAGGFTAGIHAGLDYNTFPLMAGHLVPPHYFRLSPWWRNFTENIAAVQFDHRLLATLTASVGLATALFGLGRMETGRRWPFALLAASLLLQYGLGIATLLLVVPLPLAILHQAGAVLVLASAVSVLYVTHSSPETAP
jgi:cytochrome c oxidase assembly protein subunit 15